MKDLQRRLADLMPSLNVEDKGTVSHEGQGACRKGKKNDFFFLRTSFIEFVKVFREKQEQTFKVS